MEEEDGKVRKLGAIRARIAKAAVSSYSYSSSLPTQWHVENSVLSYAGVEDGSSPLPHYFE